MEILWHPRLEDCRSSREKTANGKTEYQEGDNCQHWLIGKIQHQL